MAHTGNVWNLSGKVKMCPDIEFLLSCTSSLSNKPVPKRGQNLHNKASEFQSSHGDFQGTCWQLCSCMLPVGGFTLKPNFSFPFSLWRTEILFGDTRTRWAVVTDNWKALVAIQILLSFNPYHFNLFFSVSPLENFSTTSCPNRKCKGTHRYHRHRQQ